MTQLLCYLEKDVRKALVRKVTEHGATTTMLHCKDEVLRLSLFSNARKSSALCRGQKVSHGNWKIG